MASRTRTERPSRTRTRRTNGRPALALSTIPAQELNLLPGEMSLVCRDCKTWCPITGLKTPKMAPHRRPEEQGAHRCPSSNQLLEANVTFDEWREQLMTVEATATYRRAPRQHHKPLPEPFTPVHRLAARERTSLVHLFALLEQARHALCAHRTACTGCRAGGRCATGRDLEISFRETQATCTIAREQQMRSDRLNAQRARAVRTGQERTRAYVLDKAHQIDQLRRAVPQGALPIEGPEVPLVHLAPRQAAAQPEEGQIKCEHCGTTESGLADAVAAGWHRITRRPHCGRCAQRFPAWTRTSF
ncbi:hypothetical protein ACN6LF_006110 [[Kitasatospora] papulosa]|uniref:hypothetical protein n=1 Tax=Streptomyces sp. SL294 TaxID=2995144 RepID=UPI0016894DB9|nr:MULTISPECIES: hypothetical protein [unclassified Streptomyces]MBD2835144.1 hypothetical protein [Streptomyces pratensis]MCY1649337.1 hypothetical protein [Streptomyces sp. SL203]MCY1677049.1 hypothetical protein [Streptomyces sp. SL294]